MKVETTVHEYAEERPVEIVNLNKEQRLRYGKEPECVLSDVVYNAYMEERLVILAKNEGGCNCTEVDLIELLTWVKNNIPDVWNKIC